MASDAVNSLLDRIPGYGGYRDREQRRESDRLLREALARDYQSLADRLGRIAQRLAEERNVAAIQHVDRPHQGLTHFISRLRTASYGYSPLFSERPVEARALDQIAEFDKSLADQLDPLRERIDSLEKADPSDQAFEVAASNVSEVVDGLHERFERRGEVIERGEPQPEESVRDLLTPAPSIEPPTAYSLHDGEAVTYDNRNFVVAGRITVSTAEPLWRDFQLRGASEEHWLRVPATPDGDFWWFDEHGTLLDSSGESIQVNDTDFEVEQRIQAKAEVIGRGGSTSERNVTVSIARSEATGKLLCVYDWGTEQLVLLGSSIDPAELELWSREGGRAI